MFTELLDDLQMLPGAVAENPTLFGVAVVIAVPIIWLKWRVTGKAMEKSLADVTHGHRTQASRKEVRHDTGVGTSQVMVMRPNGVGGAIWFGLLFFGGGAAFYVFAVLPKDPSAKNWITFAGLAGFAVLSLVLIEANQTRFLVDRTGIEQRRILHPRQRILFAEIASVTPAGKSFASGVVLTDRTGQTMRIMARFSGFRELLTRLASQDATLAAMARLSRRADTAQAAGGS